MTAVDDDVASLLREIDSDGCTNTLGTACNKRSFIG
jgi:hypothetical protein